MPNQVDDIPVFLNTPGAEANPFAELIGTATISEYGTLTITIAPNELTQRVPHLTKIDQIVGLNVGLQYRMISPIENGI